VKRRHGKIKIVSFFTGAQRLLSLFAPPVAFALLIGLSYAGEGKFNEGKKIFKARKCAECHQVRGPAKEKTFQDVSEKKGPELWYAGSKFQEKFLFNWLQDPVPIRPMAYYSLTEKNPGDHERLSETEAGDVTAYLMGLKSVEVNQGVIKPKKTLKGRVVFARKFSCFGCHRYKSGGKIVGGLSGPTLVGAGVRLNAEWIYAYLKKPGVFKPVRDMPQYAGIIKDNEMKELAAFVAGFN
jgi:mono/diheme cytochrome c family protein